MMMPLEVQLYTTWLLAKDRVMNPRRDERGEGLAVPIILIGILVIAAIAVGAIIVAAITKHATDVGNNIKSQPSS
jgi:hypothetical protein